MRKTFAFVLTGMSLSLTAPAGVPGLKADEHVAGSVRVEIRGKLSLFGCRPQFLYAWCHAGSGQMYRLDFSGTQELFEAARKLESKFVVLTGTGDDLFETLHVTGVEAGKTEQEAVTVEIRGQLDRQPLAVGQPADARTEFALVGPWRTYHLDFGDNKELQEQAEKLLGQTALVKGNLPTYPKDNLQMNPLTFRPVVTLDPVLLVTGLRAAGAK